MSRHSKRLRFVSCYAKKPLLAANCSGRFQLAASVNFSVLMSILAFGMKNGQIIPVSAEL